MEKSSNTMWKLRKLKPHITASAYAEILEQCKEDASLTWLKPHWFFPDEVKTSYGSINRVINKIKLEVWNEAIRNV